MLKRYSLTIIGIMIILPVTGLAQTLTSQEKVAAIVADLATPAKRVDARAALNEADASMLVPLWDAIEDPNASATLNKEITGAFPAIYKRLREARAAKDKARDLAWIQKQKVDAYTKHGRKDPKWDAIVLEVLKSPDRDELSFEAYERGIQAGCDDPLVRYFHDTIGYNIRRITMEQGRAALPGIIADLDKCGYPDSIRLLACSRMAVFTNSSRALNSQRMDSVKNALKLLPAYSASQPVQSQLFLQLDNFLGVMDSGYWDRKTAFDLINPVVKDSRMPIQFQNYLEGSFLTRYAWDARGNGAAIDVTDEGWKLFKDRLDAAEKTLSDGWRADPLDSHCAAQMITVCMGLDKDRDVMERWFSRAMLANPDDKTACEAKMLLLDPKWGGSLADQLKFGTECVALGNGTNGISGLMIHLINDLCPSDPKEAEAFMARAAVWKELKPALEKLLSDPEVLKHNRGDYLANRGLYLRYACRCSQWKEFIDLSNTFGDAVDLNFFGGKSLFDYYMKRATDEVAKQTP